MGNQRKGRKRTNSKTSPGNKESAPKRTAPDMASNGQQQKSQQVQDNIGANQVQGVQGQGQGLCYNAQGFGGMQASSNFTMPYNQMTSPQQQLYTSPIVPFNNMGSPNVGQNVGQAVPPLPLPTNTNGVSSDQFACLCQKLDIIDAKLARLDAIESKMNTITVRLDKLDQRANTLEGKISDIEKSRSFDSKTLEEINKKQREIDTMMTKLTKIEKEQSEKDREIKADILDMKSRSMRDNLLFFGIEEERGEKDSDCINKVLNIIEEKLGLENAKTDMKIQRAHRIGRFQSNKTRPVVAKFAFYQDRERVRFNAKKLERPFGISQQFPMEVMEKRRKLVPVMLEARRQGKDARLVVDKLYVDGRLHRDDASAASD